MRAWAAGLVVCAAGVAVACDSGGSRDVTLGQSPTGPGTVTLTAPAPQSPTSDAQLDTLRPTLTVTNGTASANATGGYNFNFGTTPFSGAVTPDGCVGFGLPGAETGQEEGCSAVAA